MVNVLVWGENIHENTNSDVRSLYPEGMHSCIADALGQHAGLSVSTATLQQSEHGLQEEVLAATDVLFCGDMPLTAMLLMKLSNVCRNVCGKVWG